MLVATSQEGEEFHPFGETPAGMIMYDAGGYMSYTAMHSGRPKFASGDLAGGTSEEVMAAFSGFDAYCGTYRVNLADKVISHHVEVSKLPYWEGSEQVRFFRIEEDRLLIHSPPVPLRDAEWVIDVGYASGLPRAIGTIVVTM